MTSPTITIGYKNNVVGNTKGYNIDMERIITMSTVV
jgi:hypothetical protein